MATANSTALGAHAVVVGGGVAGITAAVCLADAGVRVTLVEKRPMLGGRASSFYDHVTGEPVDAVQHGTMRCCTQLAWLLERLGAHHQIRYLDTIHFVDRQGRHATLRGGWLPAPAHAAPSFLRLGFLSLGDKAALGRAFLSILRAGPDTDWEGVSVAEWAQRARLPETAVRRYLEPVLVSACNETLERISCRYAFMVFREGFLANPTAYHFGVPRVPLGTLYTEPTVRCLTERGGEVLLKTTVRRIAIGGGKRTVVLADGRHLTPDIVICATPWHQVEGILDPSVTAGSEYFRQLAAMEHSPIVGVHVWLDRPVEMPHCVALVERRTDWVFNKTLNFDRPRGENAYLSMVISADRELTEMPREQVFALVMEEVRSSLPQTRDAKVLRWFVAKERLATFSPRPGISRLRPDQRSPIEGLYLAGEWTDTGWPSTMESAARGGALAAEKSLQDLGRDVRFLAPLLPARGLARLLLSRSASGGERSRRADGRRNQLSGTSNT